jgi:peptidyl-prolyl cis-trans isomerase C
MRKPLQILSLAVLLVVSACGRHLVPEKPPEAGDKAVAKVGDGTIWASDVKREAVTEGLITQGEPLDVNSDLFHQVLDSVMDQKLLATEAAKRKLDQNPAAQRRLAAAKERILGDMLVETSVSKAVNDNAIRGLYADFQKSNHPAEEFHARQIIVPTQADAEADKKLLAAGAAFESLAMAKSTDAATRFSGGDLGYFTTDVMPDGYEAALKDAKPGDLIGPFHIDSGWVVMKVEDRRPEQPMSLEAARPQIVRFLTYNRVRDLLEDLRKGTKVEVLIPPASGSSGPPPAPGASQTPADPVSLTPSPPSTSPPSTSKTAAKK